MRKINRKLFYDRLRKQIGRVRQPQVDGFETIFDYVEKQPDGEIPDERQLAYILATAWHETGRRMEPVRESFQATDEEAQRTVSAWLRKNGHSDYAKRLKNGNAYYGRGYVQLTHAVNYQKAGDRLDLPLYDKPDMVMEPRIAAKILVRGMREGWFTGKKLRDYFTPTKSNTVQARRIVNALDQAEKIAGYARMFGACLAPPDL